MPDRISQYRQLRLVVNPPIRAEKASWALHATTVVKGVPHAVAIDGGVLQRSEVGTVEEVMLIMAEALVQLFDHSSLLPLRELLSE